MRYPDGGGLSPAARERRETLRLQAARLFAEDVAPVEVAARLRVSTKSVYQWRRRWRAGGEAALASTGPGGANCRLAHPPPDPVRPQLERGPARPRRGDQRRAPGPGAAPVRPPFFFPGPPPRPPPPF